MFCRIGFKTKISGFLKCCLKLFKLQALLVLKHSGRIAVLRLLKEMVFKPVLLFFVDQQEPSQYEQLQQQLQQQQQQQQQQIIQHPKTVNEEWHQVREHS